MTAHQVFLANQDFWSRRIAAVDAERAADSKTPESPRNTEPYAKDGLQNATGDGIGQSHTNHDSKTDTELLAEFNLPDPDDLTLGDDFSVFMSNAIPERLRRRALRVLWRSNPVLANVDMLVDYGENFTDSATVVENLQTAYQVGKGMLQHVDEMTRQAALADESAQAAAATPIPANSGAAQTPEIVAQTPEIVAQTGSPDMTVTHGDETHDAAATTQVVDDVCIPANHPIDAPKISWQAAGLSPEAAACDSCPPYADAIPQRMTFTFESGQA